MRMALVEMATGLGRRGQSDDGDGAEGLHG